MRKFFKIVGLVMLTLAVCLVAIYLYLTDWGRTDILSKGPRRPKMEIPITYNIGWWINQDNLQLDSFRVEVIESNLNLFNSKSLISYTLFGRLNWDGHWQPSINEIHISERINRDTTLNCDRIIEITPVIKVKDNKRTNGGTETFQITNEHTITSSNWGLNRIKFICEAQEQTIELRQTK